MFEEALIDIHGRLETARSHALLDDCMLVGALAVGTWGTPRSTDDIDFAAVSSDPAKLAEFLGGEYKVGGPDDPLRGVIHTSAGGVLVQLVLLPQRLNQVVFADRDVIDLAGHQVPIVSWRSLVMLKLYAGAPQDQIDAKGILDIQKPSAEDLRKLKQIAASLRLTQDFEAITRTLPGHKSRL
ncbi:MAG: hypothetical protein AB1714_25090 [Acidobacteriota bacterium]